MRQTSRAVALLLALESANAAATIVKNIPDTVTLGGGYYTVFNPQNSVVGNPDSSQQLNNRNAGYTGLYQQLKPNTGAAEKVSSGTVDNAGWTNATFRAAAAKADTAKATSITESTIIKEGSGCVQCIRGAGVWCSRTYAYLSIVDALQYTLKTAASNSVKVVDDPAKLITGTSFDQGACCQSQVLFNSFIGTKKVPDPVTPSNDTLASLNQTNGLPMVAPACPAISQSAFIGTKSAQAFGLSQIENTTGDFTSWWCSNGLYKKVTVKGNTIVINAQQTVEASENQRLELALVGCPQGKVMCGNSSGKILTTLTSGTKVTITMPVKLMNVNSKCTWVAYSTVSGPSFTFKDTGSPALGINGDNWEIHAMEYTSSTVTDFNTKNGSLVPGAGGVGGVIPANEALAAGNMVPLFTMPAEQFATLRTWYGEGTPSSDTYSDQTSSWLSPGRAPIANNSDASSQLASVASQLYGNVANIPVSTVIIQKANNKTSVGLANYGKYNDTPFDLRQMRYFPAKVAQIQHAAGNDALKKYDTQLATYNTAKTIWDNYVAILEKNAAQDAFAALFSPPKAPTVPPLPNKPWLPDAYTGYVRATPAEVVAMTKAATGTTYATPTASQFWTNLSAAQTVGGWGSFTATVFKYRNGWGKSFGTIGYSGDSNKLSMSDVWNYTWTCSEATGAEVGGKYPPSKLTNTQCAPTYTAVAGSPATTSGIGPLNTVGMISVVSLWSTVNKAQSLSQKGVWDGQNGFSLEWQAGEWKSAIVGLTAIDAPTPAQEAKSLTGLAGAQALVASSAAALAVAAALY